MIKMLKKKFLPPHKSTGILSPFFVAYLWNWPAYPFLTPIPNKDAKSKVFWAKQALNFLWFMDLFFEETMHAVLHNTVDFLNTLNWGLIELLFCRA